MPLGGVQFISGGGGAIHFYAGLAEKHPKRGSSDPRFLIMKKMLDKSDKSLFCQASFSG